MSMITKKLSTCGKILKRFVFLARNFDIKTAYCIEFLPHLKSVQYKHDFILQFLEYRYDDIIKKYRKRKQQPASLAKDCYVWVCWWQGEAKMPIPVKHCVQSVRKYAKGYDVQIITWENFDRFSVISPNIVDKVKRGEISLTHFSDILRCNLLADSGGVWIDAALLLTDKLRIPDLPFFSLKQKHTEHDNRYVSGYRWVVGYMGGVKGNVLHTFLKDFLNAYFEKETAAIDYFLLDYVVALAYKTIPACQKMIDDTPYSNEDFYYISNHLFSPVDKEELALVMSRTRVYKLGYRDFPDSVADNSLYAYLFGQTQIKGKA